MQSKQITKYILRSERPFRSTNWLELTKNSLASPAIHHLKELFCAVRVIAGTQSAESPEPDETTEEAPLRVSQRLRHLDGADRSRPPRPTIEEPGRVLYDCGEPVVS
jgi:hypothetical protein